MILASSSDDDSESEELMINSPHIQEESIIDPRLAKRSRGRISIVSPSVSAALDRTKTSDRKAAYILAATAQSLGHNVEDLALNRSTIKRQREYHRSRLAKALKKEFHVNVPLVVHWDGKLMADLSGKENVDRLAILISGNSVSQLLKVGITTGTGEDQARAVVEALQEWNLEERVAGLAFDTTSSNTGCRSGACVLIEQKLGKDLLHFACRHHILELIVGAAFTSLLGGTSGPDVPLFKRFKQHWEFIDQSNYSTGTSHEDVARVIGPVKQNIITFAEEQILDHQMRDDYRELLELSIIFLGEIPSRGVRFMAPGAMHHARWMSKVIYSLKVWMFRNQFKLTPFQEKGLQEFCVFSVTVYLKAWFTAPLAACAPSNDLQLLKDLHSYKDKNVIISKATSDKLGLHLWYLSEELVGLAFFDPEVSIVTKCEMVKSLQNREGENEPLKRIKIAARLVPDSRLEDFVTQNTRGLFEKLGISSEFIHHHPETWTSHQDFIKGVEIVKNIKVINDNAERGVALVQEFNQLITHDEEQFQFLLQVVSEHRCQFQDSRKSTLIAGQTKMDI